MGKKSIIEKPNWLDLEKYELAEELTTIQWTLLLEKRAMLLHEISKISANENDDHLERSHLIFQEIRQSPLSSAYKENSYAADWFHARNLSAQLNEEHPNLFQKFVTPYSCSDAYWDAKGLPDEIKNAFDNVNENLDRYSEYCDIPIDILALRFGTNVGSRVSISVDLNVPDKELIKAFERYLDASREIFDFPEGGKIKKSIFNRMIEAKVLPYLDLTIWGQLSGIDIPHHKMGDWLYPDNDEIDVAEKIRKSTKPLATRSINFSFIETLCALAE